MNVQELAIKAGLKKEHGSDREYIGDFDYNEFARLINKDRIDTIRKEWFKLNNMSTEAMNVRELAIHVGTKSGLMKAMNLLGITK